MCKLESLSFVSLNHTGAYMKRLFNIILFAYQDIIQCKIPIQTETPLFHNPARAIIYNNLLSDT